jgi:hypothetical protein
VQYDCKFESSAMPEGWAVETGAVSSASSAYYTSDAALLITTTSTSSSKLASSTQPGSRTAPSSSAAPMSSENQGGNSAPSTTGGGYDSSGDTTPAFNNATATKLGVDSSTVSITPADILAAKNTQILKLWQPPKSAGTQLSIPKIFRALLLIRPALANSVLARSEISMPPTPTPLYCLLGTEPCGNSVCYTPTKQICCPGQQNVCKIGERCAEGKKSNGIMVYGCAPPGVTGGLDAQMRTSTSTAIAAITTKIPVKAAASSTPVASFVQFPTSAGTRPSLPRILRTLTSVVGIVRAASSPSTILNDFCGGICC